MSSVHRRHPVSRLKATFDADQNRPLELDFRPRLGSLARPVDCAPEITLDDKPRRGNVKGRIKRGG
jgi:hypothetical protein